ncbi:zinc ribbon domain-containing protein [Streptomyces sp. NPDC051636]|uniref:zinc ribbon domain-containing protein n=1 Tax=Streptomyces sp. NPDC051636 TaxID=3365663 RepID=UPI0037A046B5
MCNRWRPSSKTCSACGWQYPRLTLADRTFHCTNCTLTIDRDSTPRTTSRPMPSPSTGLSPLVEGRHKTPAEPS